jgi:hypothetical protein
MLYDYEPLFFIYLWMQAPTMVMKEDLIFLHGGKQLLQHASLLRKLGLEAFLC